MNIIYQSLYYQYILDKFHLIKSSNIQSNNNNNIVLSMLYAEICPKVRRHNALHFGSCIMPSNLGTYNMDNTILLYKYYYTH